MSSVLPFPASSSPAEVPASLSLELVVRDSEVIAELWSNPAGELRDEFALKALRIGVLALRQARGQLDVDAVRREGDRLIEQMQHRLETHAKTVHDRTAHTLREYFDPQSGRFQERVERLIRRDGELEQMLRRQLGAEESELTKTLGQHFGENSELLQWLNPDQTRGLLGALRGALEEQLGTQREAVLQQFSLDNKDGALARFIAELSERQGLLTESLQEQIETVVKEFSLDQENSALSRLVRNVDSAQRTITREFSLDEDASALSKLKRMLEATNSTIANHLSLDEESSALARLKRELLGLLEGQRDQNQKFQEEVKVTLQSMIARKQEAAKSTRHGIAFEEAVIAFLQEEAQKLGDVVTPVGTKVGLIKNCKKGDLVLELGPDSSAPGAKIVLEAKQDASYQLANARAEIEEARKNRDAQLGVFVFSKQTVPTGLEPVFRLGSDVFVTWDAEDPLSDVYLRVAITLARALALRQQRQEAAQTADLLAIDQAVNNIEKAAGGLDELQTSAETVHKQTDKMLHRIGLMRKELDRQVEQLREKTAALKPLG